MNTIHFQSKMWFYQKKSKQIRIILGYRSDPKTFRIEGMDIWLPDRSKKKLFGIHKSTKNNEAIKTILSKYPEVNRASTRSSNNNRLCRIRGNFYPTIETTKKKKLENSLRVLKSFESVQYNLINDLTRHGFKLAARFNIKLTSINFYLKNLAQIV